MHKRGCVICSADIMYLDKEQLLECVVCKKQIVANAKCTNNHFVCDSCHGMEAIEYIEHTCLNYGKTELLDLTLKLMKNPKVLMHGPEHHFLVPAVLYTVYANTYNYQESLKEKLETIKHRAKQVPGGFCGQFGCCGAAVGTGIFMSVLLNSTPLSQSSWGDSQKMTAKMLEKLGEIGGPRCCKRSTFLALVCAKEFLLEKFQIELELGNVKCDYVSENPTCLLHNCPFY